jgi:hypothetical protein
VSSEDINRWIREKAARQRLIPRSIRRLAEEQEQPKEQSRINQLIRKAAGRG